MALAAALAGAASVIGQQQAKYAAAGGGAQPAGRRAHRHGRHLVVGDQRSWQWRFVTPIVGDYTGVPLNADGDRLARQWNPYEDAKAGQQCKGFGAAAINRLPTRMQISWVDDNTMKLDFDLGTQSRLVYFDKTRAAGVRSLQGHAIGEWVDLPAPGRGGGRSTTGRRTRRLAPRPRRRDAGAPADGARRTGRARCGPRAGGLKSSPPTCCRRACGRTGYSVSEKAVITDTSTSSPRPTARSGSCS